MHSNHLLLEEPIRMSSILESSKPVSARWYSLYNTGGSTSRGFLYSVFALINHVDIVPRDETKTDKKFLLRQNSSALIA